MTFAEAIPSLLNYKKIQADGGLSIKFDRDYATLIYNDSGEIYPIMMSDLIRTDWEVMI